MRTWRVYGAAAVALVLLAPAVRGQTSVSRAVIALRGTYIGSLTPMMSPSMISRTLNGAQLGLRYGLLNENGVRTQTVAASAIVLAGLQSSLMATAGVQDADCNRCSPALLLGVGGDMRIASTADVVGPASQLSISVSGDFGYAQLKPGSEHALSLGVGAPITLSIGGGGRQGLRFVPYFMPMFGVGETSNPCFLPGCQRSGTRWLLGGGIGVWNPISSLSASVGINQVMISGAEPVFGVNVVFGGR